jgi:tetratricopeptide (TPR) repeat protein
MEPVKINQTVAGWAFLVFLPACAMAPQGPSADWETLNAEALALHHAAKYDRAVDVATKALALAETNRGPDHPEVATSLTNLAALYRATERAPAADALEKRAARIRYVNQ